MTELRDARLRKAMDEAPDAGLRPGARTREAIRAAARDAVQPWWRRWWHAAGGRRTPWAAAFASVLVATLVTVMWRGEEVPGARPELPSAPATNTAPSTATQPADAASVAAPAPAPRAAPSRAKGPSAQPAPATAPAPAQASAQEPAGSLAPLRDAESRGRVAQREAAASPAALAQRAPAESLRAAPLPPAEWNQVRIEAEGHSLVVERAQAGPLPDLLARLLSAEGDADGPARPVTMRLELTQDGHLLGLLDLVNGRWRWTRLAPAQAARTLRADPALAAEVRSEAERMLRR